MDSADGSTRRRQKPAETKGVSQLLGLLYSNHHLLNNEPVMSEFCICIIDQCSHGMGVFTSIILLGNVAYECYCLQEVFHLYRVICNECKSAS